MIVAFVGWVVATAALAFIAIGARIHWSRRLTLVGIFPLALGLGGWVMLTLMTGPKPHALELRTGETALLAHNWVEGEAIYLWVRWPDEAAPRAYRLPWSEETAQQIEEAQKSNEQEGGETVVEFREGIGEVTGNRPRNAIETMLDFDLSLEDRQAPSIYAMPQPALPAKPASDPTPVHNFGEAETDQQS